MPAVMSLSLDWQRWFRSFSRKAPKATHFLVDWNNSKRDFTWALRKIKVDIRLHSGNDTVRTVTYTNPKPSSAFRWHGFLRFPFDGSK
ncbi:hypothetical protein ACQEU8_33510 [Streptomyces sp. CA-250714]|uniref:hypothetical protein n=1 Tax=Streptomyces sp. CA-250714 TaxID=3240060 RepID=UPI003D8C31D5